MRLYALGSLAAGLFCGLILVCGPVIAAEEIQYFESTIQVLPDGTLDITEKIRVRAEGRRIRRGIFRDFPVRYVEDGGYRRTVGLEIVDIRRDSKPEPYHVEYGAYNRIYIGDANVFLPRGTYTYTIRYKTTRQLRFHDEFDELYWNVTGIHWAFPIRLAVAKIQLPAEARILNVEAYTGAYGSVDKNYTITEQTASRVVLETTSNLRSRQGLTVAVAWPKGVVPAPSESDMLWRWVLDNIGLFLLPIGAVLVAVYYLVAWLRVGRDPPGGPIIPLFKPPEGLSPAALSYLHFMGFKDSKSSASKAFIAALVSLAVKGYAQIDDTGSDVAVVKSGIKPENLPSGERAIWTKLFSGRDRLVFESANGSRISDAQKKMKDALLGEYEGVFFKNNSLYLVPGAVISVLALLGFIFMHQPAELEMATLVPALIAGLLGSWLITMGGRRLLGWLPGGGSMVLGVLFTVLGSFIIVGVIWFISDVLDNASPIIPFSVLALAAMNVAFFFLIRAPTVVGRKVMDDAEGFRLYLETAEADRMNLIGAPDFTETHFESLLPYAVAMGVEKPWSQAFSDHLEKVMPKAAANGYRPHWYHGHGFDSARLSSSTHGLVSSIGSGVSSSMPRSSGSSSGSFGGGFSGGGGGGGGGGGW